MRKTDAEIGSVYVVKVSGDEAPVRLTRVSPYGGWEGMNLNTGRAVRVKTAARLRRRLPEPSGFVAPDARMPAISAGDTERAAAQRKQRDAEFDAALGEGRR